MPIRAADRFFVLHKNRAAGQPNGAEV